MSRRAHVPEGKDIFTTAAAPPRRLRVREGKSLFFAPEGEAPSKEGRGRAADGPPAQKSTPPEIATDVEAAAGEGLAGLAPVGRFTIMGELGRGRTGVLYRARLDDGGREVAVRLLHPWLVGQPGFVAALREALQPVAGLRHLNVAAVRDLCEAGGSYFVVSDLPEGEPLDRVYRAVGRLPLERVIRILIQVAVGLDYAHASGVVHGAVKPANIVVSADDRATLVDFCLGRVADEVVRTATPGAVLGSPAYLAPEQIEGRATAAADRYAFAAVAFTLLAGRPPFVGDDPLVVLLEQAAKPPPLLSSLRPDLPPALDAILARGLAKDPAVRPASCASLVRELAAAIRGEDAVPVRAPSPARRQPTRLLVAGVAAVLIFLAGLLAGGSFGGIGGLLARTGGNPPAVASSTPPPEVAGAGSSGGTPWAAPVVPLVPIGEPAPTATATTTPTPSPTALAASATPAATVPSGTLVVPRLASDGTNTLFTLALTDKLLKPLAAAAGVWDWAPAPSPDGEWLVFSTGSPSRSEIAVMRRDGSERRVVVRAGGLILTSPWWTPDGRIAFGGAWGGRAEVFSVDPASSDLFQLTQTAGSVEEVRIPTFARAGELLVFSGKQGGLYRVFLQPPGEAPRPVSPPGANAYTPALAPDGRRIAFSGTLADGQAGIFSVGVDGGDLKRLAAPAAGSWACCAAWSPDGRWLAYIGDIGQGATRDHGNVYVVPAGGGQPIRLTDDGRTYYWRPAWLP